MNIQNRNLFGYVNHSYLPVRHKILCASFCIFNYSLTDMVYHTRISSYKYTHIYAYNSTPDDEVFNLNVINDFTYQIRHLHFI